MKGGCLHQIPGTVKKLIFFYNDFLFLYQGAYQKTSHTSKVLRKRGTVKKKFLADLLTDQIWGVDPNVPHKVQHWAPKERLSADLNYQKWSKSNYNIFLVQK